MTSLLFSTLFASLSLYHCHHTYTQIQLQYQRAHVLLALGHYEDAIETLDLVLTLAPKEPPVYSLLGTHVRAHISPFLFFFTLFLLLYLCIHACTHT